MLGLLVHRLFQYVAADDAAAPGDLVERARSLLGAVERSDPSDLVATGAGDGEDVLLLRAVAALQAIRSDPRVRALVADGNRWHHEVAFSMYDDGVILRGVIDLLVEREDRVTVVEIKTGASRPEHAQQLEVYRVAAQRLFPGRPVDGVLLYARIDP